MYNMYTLYIYIYIYRLTISSRLYAGALEVNAFILIKTPNFRLHYTLPVVLSGGPPLYVATNSAPTSMLCMSMTGGHSKSTAKLGLNSLLLHTTFGTRLPKVRMLLYGPPAPAAHVLVRLSSATLLRALHCTNTTVSDKFQQTCRLSRYKPAKRVVCLITIQKIDPSVQHVPDNTTEHRQ
jgi:hypothetical protein